MGGGRRLEKYGPLAVPQKLSRSFCQPQALHDILNIRLQSGLLTQVTHRVIKKSNTCCRNLVNRHLWHASALAGKALRARLQQLKALLKGCLPLVASDKPAQEHPLHFPVALPLDVPSSWDTLGNWGAPSLRRPTKSASWHGFGELLSFWDVLKGRA